MVHFLFAWRGTVLEPIACLMVAVVLVVAMVVQMFLFVVNVVLLILVAILAYGPWWGSLLALTIPIAVALYLAGMATVALWVLLDIPVGPGAPVFFQLP